MRFTVEMGKISTSYVESSSNLFDLNGNAIEGNVKFEKTVANIDLNQALTSFTVTLNNNMNHCSNVKDPMCSDEIKEKITTLLGLNSSDQSRIVEVESVSADLSNADVVSAQVKILPTDREGDTRMLHRSEISKSTSNTNHSVRLFRDLQSAVEKNSNQSRVLVPNNNSTELPNLNNMVIVVSDMKILPGDLDVKLVTTDLEVIEEEEDLYCYGSMQGNNAALNQPLLSKVEREAMVEEIENKSKTREEAMVEEIKKEERGMVEEIDNKSKSREEAMIDEIESKSKTREEAMVEEINNKFKSREEAMMSKIERMSDIEDALFRELKDSKQKSQSELKMLQFELMAVTLASVGISLIAYLSLRR